MSLEELARRSCLRARSACPRELPKGMLTSQVPPVYPPIAKQARVQGVIKLQAVIGENGVRGATHHAGRTGDVARCGYGSGSPVDLPSDDAERQRRPRL